MEKTMYAAVISDGDTFIYEDVKTGIVFTSDGSLPDSDEIEHVENYHAGKLCPIIGPSAGCAFVQSTGVSLPKPCHDAGLAGKW